MTAQIPNGDGEGVFRLWEYRVSHSQLLIRCPKLLPESSGSRNVDLKFYNVEYINLPTDFHDLEIDEPNQDEISFANRCLGKPIDAARIFVLKSREGRHLVIAGALAISESVMGVFESPFALPPVDFSKAPPIR